MFSEDLCPICLEALDNAHLQLLPCLHKYCTHCISQWSYEKKECPMCKQNIQATEPDTRLPSPVKQTEAIRGEVCSLCQQESERIEFTCDHCALQVCEDCMEQFINSEWECAEELIPMRDLECYFD